MSLRKTPSNLQVPAMQISRPSEAARDLPGYGGPDGVFLSVDVGWFRVNGVAHNR